MLSCELDKVHTYEWLRCVLLLDNLYDYKNRIQATSHDILSYNNLRIENKTDISEYIVKFIET
jgi:hypothetical protein